MLLFLLNDLTLSLRSMLVAEYAICGMLKSWRRFCTWMATELDPGPISPTMGFFVCISRLPASAVHLPWFSSSSLDTSVSRMNSILCSSATAECQHESLVWKIWVHTCLGEQCGKKRRIKGVANWMLFFSLSYAFERTTCLTPFAEQ